MKTGKVGLFVVLVIILGFLSSCGQSQLLSVAVVGNSPEQIPIQPQNSLDLRFIDQNNQEIPNLQFELVCINSPDIQYDQTSNNIAEQDNGTVIFANIVAGQYRLNITNQNYQLVQINKDSDGYWEYDIANQLTPCIEPGGEKYFIILRHI